jgi:hypothetical protein
MRLSDDQLIKLWQGDETATEISARLQVPAKVILSNWRRLRVARLLPEGERPRSSLARHLTKERIDTDYSLTVGNDRLLEKLREKHG